MNSVPLEGQWYLLLLSPPAPVTVLHCRLLCSGPYEDT